MRIATWNVNSLRARLPLVLEWIKSAQPDVLCLQEIKCQAAEFPTLEIEALGYQSVIVGQRSYNGVAILSRVPLEDVQIGLPGEDEDVQSRYVQGTLGGIVVGCLYAPNGNPVESDKYPYKLRWMARLERHVRGLLERELPLVLTGDYNICPTDDDVYDPVGWRDDALCRAESRAAYRSLVNLGLTDAFRALHPEPHQYSFWDYQAGRWFRDEGLRIDHALLSPQAADLLVACAIDREPRGRERASDHTPVICELAVLTSE